MQSIISCAAIKISFLVLNLPIPTLIDELANFLLNPRAIRTCEGFGEDEVHAEPDEIAIFDIDVTIDCPFNIGKLRFKFPAILFLISPLTIVFGYLFKIFSNSRFLNFKIFFDSF